MGGNAGKVVRRVNAGKERVMLIRLVRRILLVRRLLIDGCMTCQLIMHLTGRDPCKLYMFSTTGGTGKKSHQAQVILFLPGSP